MVGCVEGILGMRPDFGGLRIAPSVPKDWKSFSMEKTFRGKKLKITVENPDGVQSGWKECYVNGEKLSDNYIPATKLTATTEIKLVM